MKKTYSLVLCEGLGDQILLGSFLEKTCSWVRLDKYPDTLPSFDDRTTWYESAKKEYVGVWHVGGNDFSSAISTIAEMDKLEHHVNSLIVITDHDDDSAEYDRPKEIYRHLNSLQLIDMDPDWVKDNNNKWMTLKFFDRYDTLSSIEFCYLLIPLEKQGALETFMLETLSSQDVNKKNAIEQVIQFVDNFKSSVYLSKRREKTKAKLNISMTVFNPTILFKTLAEEINSVDWGQYETTNHQFEILKRL